MKLRTFLLIAAIIIALYGVCFLFIPNSLMAIYGVELNTPGRFVALYLGSALVGIAVTWWRLREAKTPYEFHEGGLLGGSAMSISGLIVSFIDALSGSANRLIWLNPLIYVFLSVGFVYFYLANIKKRE
jgi:hypothetical protein